ncbi:MAG: UDP-2,4-diacetamido-2,4,6-trideoxy-beta-L-altropyranose hydrolase [Proteobacteria bacterium]|nr:UDP-2,4-diacetamido-2,4,6-trideoxy-beta-L-altropyranose hydrolase [Pseudomonadota bacterium]
MGKIASVRVAIGPHYRYHPCISEPDDSDFKLTLGCSMGIIQRVAIRVDASIEMGMGHLARCMSLANALASHGVKIVFIMREHASVFSRIVEACGHTLLLLRDSELYQDPYDLTAHAHWLPVNPQQDAAQTLEAIGGIGDVDWLIVDHYALDANWERQQRKQALRVLVIDDLADRVHDCDILLDQNLVLNPEARYSSLVPAACQQMLGPGYALLRPEFAEARKSLTDRSGEVRRILVCYGGSDPSNETAKALAAIKHMETTSLAIDVVIGLGNPHADRVSGLCLELRCVELHRGTDNMAELMGRADLAIGAGGIMNWERCCLGLPTIAVDVAANQVRSLAALASAGALIHLGSAQSVNATQIATAIGAMIEDSARIRSMRTSALALVDGEGVGRMCSAMHELTP